jgi:hexosaminidase
MAGYAEIGWTQKTKRSWDDYKERLSHHNARLMAMGINFYKSSQIDWK